MALEVAIAVETRDILEMKWTGNVDDKTVVITGGRSVRQAATKVRVREGGTAGAGRHQRRAEKDMVAEVGHNSFRCAATSRTMLTWWHVETVPNRVPAETRC